MSNQSDGSFDRDLPFEVLPDGPRPEAIEIPKHHPNRWRNSLSFIVPLVVICLIVGAFSYSSGYDRGLTAGRIKAAQKFANSKTERVESARVIWQMAMDEAAAQKLALAAAERNEVESKAEYERLSGTPPEGMTAAQYLDAPDHQQTAGSTPSAP